MKFLSDLFSRKRADTKPADAPIENFADIANRADAVADQVSTSALIDSVNEKVGDKTPKVNIWDTDEDLPPVASLEEIAPSAPAPAKAPSRARRTKTRLIGFESSAGVVDLFDSTPAAAPMKRAKFPVGWAIVVEGPGRGECFALESGMSQIGRGEDQAIQLDFGDNAVSRTNHAAIVYDAETHTFLLGHGGKSNIVRLNDKPVISNEDIKDGDMIRIGETTLRFTPLCSPDFNWADTNTSDDEESDDVAIA
jgi:hypothetical protein